MKLFTSLLVAASADQAVERFMTQSFINCEHNHLATTGTNEGGASCPKNKVIRVMGATYGRNDADTCHGGNAYGNWPECSLDVTEHAAADCDGKRSCNYNANNREIKDPCVGTTKFTEVLYKCESSEGVEDAVKESISCEHSHQGNNDRRISCDAGKVLEIVDAWYGREEQDVCNPNGSSHKHYLVPDGGCNRDATDFMSDRCNGKRACSIKLNNGMVGDPCRGTTKYSTVQFKCKNECDHLDAQPVFQAGSEVECRTKANGNKKCIATCTSGNRTGNRRNIWTCDRSDPVWVENKPCA
ncbi:Oidioi.mRNA.OKI2018_I69.chr2.g4494.t1.cds [Oikopleura dioica]|uniref:Oidioi.mRNA.OKI2018_I69.chr2.g4494.t1.cds n=1 Tax=Oikopleura dioica TaxID=34765 RepID=A0ABN7SXH4_OIKDI|nr:Oidioi.mRNA.OKI2018_I69.chr2.g4494.t1.cds [Oikopleura dioica]